MNLVTNLAKPWGKYRFVSSFRWIFYYFPSFRIGNKIVKSVHLFIYLSFFFKLKHWYVSAVTPRLKIPKRLLTKWRRSLIMWERRKKNFCQNFLTFSVFISAFCIVSFRVKFGVPASEALKDDHLPIPLVVSTIKWQLHWWIMILNWCSSQWKYTKSINKIS